jgi:hypothetical protein
MFVADHPPPSSRIEAKSILLGYRIGGKFALEHRNHAKGREASQIVEEGTYAKEWLRWWIEDSEKQR